jgi:hypothetical protein
MKEVWPNFFIVGAPKAGTTSLYHYLKNIPDIFMSPKKEPHYFSKNVVPEGNPAEPIRDKTLYMELFKKSGKRKILGEASVSYLEDVETPSLIKRVSPDAKCLISLRDPVERIFSEYLMYMRIGKLNTSFHSELHNELKCPSDKLSTHINLNAGLYYQSVKRYVDIFGEKNIKIIIFEDFVKNILTTMNDILKFLDLNFTLENIESEAYNPFAVPRGKTSQKIMYNKTLRKITDTGVIPQEIRKFVRTKFLIKPQSKPLMPSEDRETLINFYENDVKNLEIFLGRKLPWKNFHQ